MPLAIHLGESPEEVEFLRSGGGPFLDAPRRSRRLESGVARARLRSGRVPRTAGLAAAGLLAVHAVQLTDGASGRLADAGGLVVTCPRSNAWVGVGLPPVAHFYAAGVPVAIGTDSLASAPS